MDITVNELKSLLNDQNKSHYDTLYQLIVSEYENALRYTDIISMSEEKLKAMGTCGIYISSIVELLHTVRDLMRSGYIESGGIVAAAIWERALTLRKLCLDPIRNSEIHVRHQKVKKTPWRINEMVNDVIEGEHRIKPKQNKLMETQLFYLQYTFLCSIKHGNPYTISYLNRPDRGSETTLFKNRPNDTYVDKDLKTYIMLLAGDNALDALMDYTKLFRTTTAGIQGVRDLSNQIRTMIPLTVPHTFETTPEEMGVEFWEHLFKY